MRKNLVVFVALAMIMIPSAISAKVKYDYGIAQLADSGWGEGESLKLEPRKGWLIYVINFAQ